MPLKINALECILFLHGVLGTLLCRGAQDNVVRMEETNEVAKKLTKGDIYIFEVKGHLFEDISARDLAEKIKLFFRINNPLRVVK